MKEITIEDFAYSIKKAKQNNQPQPIFFLGAGASVTGNIPSAKVIAERIMAEHADNPFIRKLTDRSYSDLMGCLEPFERNELLKKIIDEAKINVTHIYLAQLYKYGFADYVLTVNFDNLMLRALSLYNVFPATYDMAVLKDLTTTTFKEKSVVYLHGQHHGLWLLNTTEEMDKVRANIPRIFDSIKNRRPWIFIGYSGTDPIFEHVKGLGRFDNGLYWVGYREEALNEEVQTFLNTPNTNASYIKGYDADAFMVKLNELLGLPQPEILDKPFSSLKTMLNEINDIDDEEHFKGVRERLEMAKKDVEMSIRQFEDKELISLDENELAIDKLKIEIIRLLISEKFNEKQIAEIEKEAESINNSSINDLLARLYLGWGTTLENFAHTKEGKEAEDLYLQAFEKYQKAIDIKPDFHEAFYNWGTTLGTLAQTKAGKEAEDFYRQALEKYLKAIEIKPNFHEALYNWGAILVMLAKTKEGKEAEDFYLQAIEKYQKAIDFGGGHYNLACLYALRGNKTEALHHLNHSLSAQEYSIDYVLQDSDWQEYFEDNQFKSLIEGYMK